MVVPDSQDGQHISGEAAMDSNEGPKDTVPVLHRTAGSNGLIPGIKELCHHRLPSGGKMSGQLLGLWLQDRSVQPCPPDQMHGGSPKLLDRLLLDHIQIPTEGQKTRKRCLHMTEQLLQSLFQGWGSDFT